MKKANDIKLQKLVFDGKSFVECGIMKQEGLIPGMMVIDTCIDCGKGFTQRVRQDGSIVLGDDVCDDCQMKVNEMFGIT